MIEIVNDRYWKTYMNKTGKLKGNKDALHKTLHLYKSTTNRKTV